MLGFQNNYVRLNLLIPIHTKTVQVEFYVCVNENDASVLSDKELLNTLNVLHYTYITITLLFR